MGSPRVLLVTPPFDFSEMNTAGGRGTKQAGYYLLYPPIGLCSIAASLERAGFEAAVIDGQADAGGEEELLRLIEAARPDIVGFSVTTPALPVVARLIRATRERLGVPIVVGGPHVSCDPQIVTALGADYGVVGDGEEPMVALAESLLRGAPLDPEACGIVTPASTDPPCPALADLNAIPSADRKFLRNPDAYFNPFIKTRTTMLITARGCAFHCSFCCRTPSMGEYRPIDEEKVFAEMEQVSRGGHGFVSIIDETFTYDRERALRLAREMKRRGFGFKWSCQTRADLIDAELLREFSAAGCVNISFGVESGDPDAREEMDKKIPDAAFERAFAGCRDAGISTNAFIIIGGPDETPETIERSIRRAIELEPDYVVYNVGTLFPGTREYEQRIAAGEVDRTIWDRYLRGETQMPALSRRLGREELAEYLRSGYTRFYMRPRYILKKLGSVRSARDIFVLARQARTVIADYVVS
ncbi:MAG: radical SAM protein [bacterium]